MTDTKANPTNSGQWEEYIRGTFDTPEKLNAAIASGDFAAKLAGYQGATAAEFRTMATEQFQAVLIEMNQRNGTPVNGRLNLAADKAAAYSPDAPGASLKVWKSGGQMLHDILTPDKRLTAEQSARLSKYTDFTAAYSEKVPSEGGFLVPEEVRSMVMTRALEDAIVRPKAQVVPMSTGRMKWPVVDFTTEVGEVFGGIIMSWLDEGQTIPETSATFAALELVAHKLGGLASLPNELVRDAPALEAWVRQNLPNAIKHFEDLGFLVGDGVKKPLGALNGSNPALIVVGDEAGQSTATITWNNVLAMLSRLLPESWGSAEWIITPDALPEIYTMALPVGTGGSAVMVGEGKGSERLPNTLAGLPITWSRKAPAVLGTQGDISLVDLSTYVIGDTQTMTLDTSEHSSFRSDKTDFRIIERIDGQPGLLSPLTPQNNGPTLSAYIQLETRSLD
jgi:HK97 family phage major capsid protein